MIKTGKQNLKYLSIGVILPLIAFTIACEQSTLPTATEDVEAAETGVMPFAGIPGNAGVNGSVAAQLSEVRRLTASYQNFDKAAEAGWFAQLSPCVEHPELGGMGYHYGNPEYLGNGILDPLMPEVLLYEPQKNGRLRLVAVEYIVSFGPPEIEGGEPVQGEQPYLFGQGFDNSPHVGPFGSWTLHVWLWRHNPSGMFAEFNPNVNCDHAP